MPLVLDRLLDLLTSSPAHHHCTTDAPVSQKKLETNNNMKIPITSILTIISPTVLYLQPDALFLCLWDFVDGDEIANWTGRIEAFCECPWQTLFLQRPLEASVRHIERQTESADMIQSR